MSEKSGKKKKNISKKKNSTADFIKGSNYVQDLYRNALSEILGKKLGVKVSKYLLNNSLKKKSKKK